MTKKHFEALAAAVREARIDVQDYEQYEGDGGGADTLLRVTGRLADVCAQFSPRFDRTRFLAACGVEGS